MELEDYKAKIKNAYSYPPQRLRENGSVIFFNRYEERQLNRLLELKKGDTVLDACCGYGRWALRIAQKVKKIVAVDLSQHFIEELREWNIHNIEAICADITKLQYKKYFDIVICSGGLEHFKDKISILKQFYRMMKNGGRIYISCWTTDMLTPLRKQRGAEAGEMRIGDKSWYIDEPSSEELAQIMKISGFSNVHVRAIYRDTKYLPKNSDEAFKDYILFPRKVNVVNIAYAKKLTRTRARACVSF